MLSMELNQFSSDAEDGTVDSMKPEEIVIIAFQKKIDTGYILVSGHLCDILVTKLFSLAYIPEY